MIRHYGLIRRFIRCICAVGLLLACTLHSGTGHACTATAADVFSVGNKTADSTCDYGSIQDAINAATCAAGTKIVINQSGDYTNQHLTITSKNITLIGRGNATQCNAPQAQCGTLFPCPTAPLRTISGGSNSVITVRGTSNVTVQYLIITGGNHGGGGAGGGIDFDGSGSLTLDTSYVSDNTADYGGGINFTGRDSNNVSTLTLGANAQVKYNTADAAGSPSSGSGAGGGGIRMDGYVLLNVNSPGNWIWHNTAPNGNGGGILMVSGTANFGAVSYGGGGFPLIYENEAQYGGGIAIFANSYEAVDANFFPVDATHPIRIEGNTAYQAGGAIYVKSYVSGGYSAWAYANMGGVRVDGNFAQQGSAIYSDVDTGKGAQVFFYASHCATGTQCNSVSNNVAQDRNGNATTGSTILLQTGAVFAAHALRMTGNSGDHAIRVVDSADGPPVLDTCLFDHNATTTELVTFGNATAAVNQCTFASNSPGGAAVLRTNGNLTLTNSIFAQGSFTTLMETNSGATKNLDYVMSMEVASLSGGAHIMQGDPGFVDPGNGDFHLLANGPAVDFAPAGGASDHDLDNRPRDQDLPDVPNRYGPRDLGAYERVVTACDAVDTIFCSGFEAN
jgi:predicted outer membrane repeat protein